jgi:TRAP-type C4-dicarboxylate transport system permease small subunit
MGAFTDGFSLTQGRPISIYERVWHSTPEESRIRRHIVKVFLIMTVGSNKEDLPWVCRMPVLTAINRICIAASGIIILILLVYNSYATCARYLFNAPPPGSTEISTFMLPVIVFLGLAYNLETDKHICVDVFVYRMTAWKQTILMILTTALIALAAVILLWKGTILFLSKIGEVSDSELRLPLFPFYFFVPLGGLLLLLESIRKICFHFYTLIRSGDGG